MFRPTALPLAVGALVMLLGGCVSAKPTVAHSFASTPRAISELKRGWADAVVGDYPVMAYMARESMGTLEVVREQFEPEPFGIGVKTGSSALHAALSDALRRLMAETTYMDILRSWAIHIGRVEPPPPPASVPETSEVPELADGTLTVGMELAFAPMEFYDELKHQAGADVELANTLGKALGVQVRVVDIKFDALLPALQRGEIDAVISAMTITPERAAQADFIPYLLAGTGILVKAGNPKQIRRMGDLCGKTVALQEGTAQVEMISALECR